MSSHSKARDLLKRFTIATVAAVALVLLPALTTPAHAHDGHDKIGGSIHRSEVIERAWTWVRRGIQYSQSGVARDAERHHVYRRDCSGYVSMAWHIKPTGLSAPWTGSLPNRSTAKSKANLKRGDILLDPGNHVVIFHKWANAAHTEFWLFEQSNPTTDMNHRQASLSSFSGFTARRYNHILKG
ncbi:MAG: hypothetical protein ACRDT8_14445 [Micromonosporaceae bacterium]